MLNESELFDQAVRALSIGRRLPDDSQVRSNPILAQNKALVERVIQGFRDTGNPHRPLPAVLVDYVDSHLADACAFRCNNYYIIAIHSGLWFIPMVMVNLLLCNRDFLPELGNIHNEANNTPRILISADFRNVAGRIQALGLPFDALIPKDPIRKEVVRFMVDASTIFFMGHEFRHIQAGHTDYYFNGFKLDYISELPSHNKDASIAMKQQAMEWDADQFSIRALLAEVFRTRDEARRRPSDYSVIYQNDRLLLLLCIIACAGFFSIFDMRKPAPSIWQTLPHPPSRNRRVMLATSALIWLELARPDIFHEELSSEIGILCGIYMDTIFASAFGTAFDRDYSVLALREGRGHVNRIMATWRVIMSDLSKYSYVPLNPF